MTLVVTEIGRRMQIQQSQTIGGFPVWRTLVKVISGLLVVTVITGCSALLATIYATRQIAAVIRQSSEDAQSQEELVPVGMTSVSFQELTRIPTDDLLSWFETQSAEHGLQQVRLVMRFTDAAGRCLVNSPVGLRWTLPKISVDQRHFIQLKNSRTRPELLRRSIRLIELLLWLWDCFGLMARSHRARDSLLATQE